MLFWLVVSVSLTSSDGGDDCCCCCCLCCCLFLSEDDAEEGLGLERSGWEEEDDEVEGMPRAVAKAWVSSDGPECLVRTAGPRDFLLTAVVSAVLLLVLLVRLLGASVEASGPACWAAAGGATGEEARWTGACDSGCDGGCGSPGPSDWVVVESWSTGGWMTGWTAAVCVTGEEEAE